MHATVTENAMYLTFQISFMWTLVPRGIQKLNSNSLVLHTTYKRSVKVDGNKHHVQSAIAAPRENVIAQKNQLTRKR